MATNYVVLSTQGVLDLLNQLITYLNGLKLCLFVNNITVAYNLAADGSAFTEATFPGYARGTLAYASAVTNAAPPDGDLLPALNTFTSTAPTTPNQTIYGWFVMDTVAGKWVFAANTNRSPAVVIANTGDAYQLQARLTGAIYAAYP